MRALLRTAIASRSMDVIAALVPRLSGDALDMLMIHMPECRAPCPRCGRLCLAVSWRGWKAEPIPAPSRLPHCTAASARPLPPELAERLLASAGWRDYLAALAEEETDQRKTDTESLMHTAMLLPAACMPAFLAAIEPLPPAINRKARDFAHFVLALPAPAPASDER